MKEVEDFKTKNGGTIDYTVKELLGGLHTKIDKLEDQVKGNWDTTVTVREKIAETSSKSEKKIAIIETFIGIHTLLLIAIVGKLLFF